MSNRSIRYRKLLIIGTFVCGIVFVFGAMTLTKSRHNQIHKAIQQLTGCYAIDSQIVLEITVDRIFFGRESVSYETDISSSGLMLLPSRRLTLTKSGETYNVVGKEGAYLAIPIDNGGNLTLFFGTNDAAKLLLHKAPCH